MPRSLYARAALTFAAILLVLGALLSWFGYGAAKRHQHQILQQVNLALAGHIAAQPPLFDSGDAGHARTDALFSHLMAVNPNIEVYLLDADGAVLRASPEIGTPERDRIDLTPVRRLLAGAPLPVLGDNPRHDRGREIFSAAPIRDAGGTITGYVYIVLLNDMYRDMVGAAWRDYVLRSAAWIAAFAVLVALAAGLTAFALITRRLRRVTREVEAFAGTPGEGAMPVADPKAGGDEIDRLSIAFAAMRARLQTQMHELQRQDELRRELVANVSHDLRTPLTSMQGYLETLVRMDPALSREEQRQYLDIAVRQSHKVSRLAQQLFELARLECEETLPQPELFSIGELVQDIAQKYALTAQEKALQLHTHVETGSLLVRADIGMIERVVSNLMDNAIRHTPEHGEIRLEAGARAQGVEICVSDTGQGIPAEHLPGLLVRGSPLRQMAIQRGGGLGLLIANRILDLHGSRIQAASDAGQGTRVSFVLATTTAA
ncbi:sensor histidine kinase [Luteimonas salinilitoris]|uniref:histidine kinase n=1 Tax=Luteimonas salinilitoris TaxID=3237697 RepID=A0ABV4HQM1_9GAMM